VNLLNRRSDLVVRQINLRCRPCRGGISAYIPHQCVFVNYQMV